VKLARGGAKKNPHVGKIWGKPFERGLKGSGYYHTNRWEGGAVIRESFPQGGGGISLWRGHDTTWQPTGGRPGVDAYLDFQRVGN